MADRTYVFRLAGDASDLKRASEEGVRAVDALNSKASAGFNEATESAGKAGHATAGVTREFLVLAHELSQGNFKKFGGSLLVLAEFGAKAVTAFVASIGPIVAVGAAIAAFTYQVVKGYHEQQQFNKDLLITGNAAGLTAIGLDELTKSVSRATGASVLASRDILSGLAASGEVGPRLLEPLGAAVVRIQQITGEEKDKIVADYAKIAEAPAKFALEKNKAFNFISGDQYAYIKSLEEQGKKEEAALEVTRLLSAHFAGPLADSIIKVDSFTKRLTDQTAALVAEIRGIGRAFADPTAEEKLDSLYVKLKRLQELSGKSDKFNSSIPGSSGSLNAQQAEQTQQEITATLYANAGAKRQAFFKAEDDAAHKRQVAAIEERDQIRDRTHGLDLANKKIDEYRRKVVDPLKGTANAISPAEQAAEEAAIRKRANPDAFKAGKALDTRFEERLRALTDEGIKLDAETKNYEKYGKAINDSRLATLNLEIAQGKLKGLSADRIAQLRTLATADDAKAHLLAETEARVNATKAAEKFIEKLETEAGARAKNARETGLATGLAQLEATGLDKRSVAYQLFVDRLESANDARFNQITANKLAAQQLASDDEVRKLDAETAALGLGTLARQKAITVEKLRKEADKDSLADPASRAAIEDALTKKIDDQTAALTRNYEASRLASTGIDAAFTRYTDDASNAAKFSENVIGGGLQKLEDSLVHFAETGKLSFGDLFKYMASEFIRQLARMQVAQATSGLGEYLKIGLSAIGAYGGNSGFTSAANSGTQGDPTFYSSKQSVPGVSKTSAATAGSPAALGGKSKISGSPITVNNYVGADVSAKQNDDGSVTLDLLRQVEDRAAKRGADAGYARVVDDHARGTGRSSQALKARGVGLSAGSRRA